MYYLNEHVSCKYYSYTVQNGFATYSIPAGECVVEENRLSDNLAFAHSGSFNLSLDGNSPILFQSGDFLYVPAGVKVECRAETDTQILILSCATHDLYDRLIQMREKNQMKLAKGDLSFGLRAFDQSPHLRNFVSNMWSYLSDGLKCKHLQDSKMKEVLVLLNFYYTDDELNQLFHPVISNCENTRFRAKVLRNADQSKNAVELAQLCGFGIRQFERKFKTVFENTPYQWMLEQKKRNLLDKLVDKELPIKHIVMDFEFCSVSHLNEFCKRYYGKTSADIRKKITA